MPSPRSRPIDGSATLTTVVSSPTRKMLVQQTASTSHRRVLSVMTGMLGPRTPGYPGNLRRPQTALVDPSLAELLDGIGPRLRRIRQDRGLTLDDLATATGLSVSTLSRLESGKRRPTLDLLIPLARTHRMALDHLIGAPNTGDPRAHLTPHRTEPRTGNPSVVVPLTTYPGRLQVFKQILGTGRDEPRLV